MKWLRSKRLLNESKRMLSINQWRRRLFFWSGGLAVGLFCVAFAIVCDHCNNFIEMQMGRHRSWAFLITPLGFMAIVWIMRRWFVGAEGSGIPQVIAALQLTNLSVRDRLVSLRIAVGKFCLTALGFLCGASIGREGPTIQLSASIMQAVWHWGGFHRHDAERGLLLAGGAAGIAAAFNAPLAGVVFAIEELSGSFEKGLSGTIITTVVLCGIVAQYVLGNYHYFGTSPATLNIIQGGWIVLLMVAILGGALGGIFSWLLIRLSRLTSHIMQLHPVIFAGVLGLCVAMVGYIAHGSTYGSGYAAAKDLITNHNNMHVVASYGPLKMLATLLTYLSGLPGGIFAPSLSAGAGFGQIFTHLFANHFHDAVILMSTAAYFSGVVQSPITCFVIVLEMTDSASGNMVLPIMLVSVIAAWVSKMICREPLYHVLAKSYLDRIRARES